MRTKKPLKCCHCTPGRPCKWHINSAQQDAWYDRAYLPDGSYTLIERERPRLRVVSDHCAERSS